MTKRRWDKVALDQFKTMPAEFQDDWGELRKIIYKG
jgi:hypothetical protein